MLCAFRREEYIEQAYFYQRLLDRWGEQFATQEMLVAIRHEILATSKLSLALDYLAADLRLYGMMSSAMTKLSHYFTPFQAFLVSEAEREGGKFELNQALHILQREATYRAEQPTPQGLFLFQFESLCRNRLNYDRGLTAISNDPLFDIEWHDWILLVRKQVGFLELSELIYVRSEFAQREAQRLGQDAPPTKVLFGEKEGRIAAANRQRDPLLLFAALHRQLGYPAVPFPDFQERAPDLIPSLMRRIERLETK